MQPDDGCVGNRGPHRLPWGFYTLVLMLTPDGPKVLEFNCRLGDPETQAIVARMDFDLSGVLMATAEGRLRTDELKWQRGASICVVMASGGYPGKYVANKEIHGLEEAAKVPGVTVFHAGTRRKGAIYYTSSGRVLGVIALGGTLDAVRRSVYDAVREIRFSDCQYRSDIALAGCRVANVGED